VVYNGKEDFVPSGTRPSKYGTNVHADNHGVTRGAKHLLHIIAACYGTICVHVVQVVVAAHDITLWSAFAGLVHAYRVELCRALV
jgi:hypothetical protein